MKMEYYVGILPEDREKFDETVEYFNDSPDWRFRVKLLSEFDDPEGYYTIQIEGTPDSYGHFLRNAQSGGFVKSLNHFEE